MLQKLVIGSLVVTLFGAVGLSIYDSTSEEDSEVAVLRSDEATATPPPTQAAVETEVVVAELPTAPAAQPEPVQQQDSLTMMGESWQSAGVVVALDDVGLTLDDGTYVEVAPPFFWAELPLNVGDEVAITGFNNGEQIHTQTLTLNGESYDFRTAEGQPLWSGGAGNEQNGAGNQQIPMTDWLSYKGTLSDITNNNMTLRTNDGQLIALQLGQPRFREEQGITLVAGDLIKVSGYWQGDQFRVGTLTKTMTDETMLLLDPNGRPLWGGPGRGNGSGSGQGQNESGQGQGNGYRGGHGNTTDEAAQ